MTSFEPIYKLIDATPRPRSRRVDRTGFYEDLEDANQYLHHSGPPLPIVVQCLPHQRGDLDDLTRLVKSVPGGNSNQGAETYIKAVIPLNQNLVIWNDIPKFYVAINGNDVPKYVAQRWRYMSDLTSGDLVKTPSFSTFIHAFIFALAGGDQPLRAMQLHDRWGWKPMTVGSTPSNVPHSQPTVANTSSNIPRFQPTVANTSSNISRYQPTVANTSSNAPRSQLTVVNTPSNVPLSQPTVASRLSGNGLSSVQQPAQPRMANPTPPPVPEALEALPSTPAKRISVTSATRASYTPDVFKTPVGSSDESASSVEGSPHLGAAQSLGSTSQPKPHNPGSPLSPLQDKGKRRATVPIRGLALPVRGRGTPSEPKISNSALKQKASPPTPAGSGMKFPQSGIRFCSPATLVPPSVLTNPRAATRSLPVLCTRTPKRPGVGEVLWSQDLFIHDDTLFLPATTDLPPFVEFSLRALGWDNDLLNVAQVSWSSRGSRDAFIITLADVGIPMAEAYFVWELIQRVSADQ